MSQQLLAKNASTVQAAQHVFVCVGGLDSTGATPTERPLALNSSGQIIVVIVPGAPGGNIVTDADVAVGVGVTAALGIPGATTRTMSVQNTGAAGSLVRIRAVGGVAGSGLLLGSREIHIYSEGIEQEEAENTGAIAATVAVQYETA